MYLMHQAGRDYDVVTRFQKTVDLLEFIRLRGIEDEQLLDFAKKYLKLYSLENKSSQDKYESEKTVLPTLMDVQGEPSLPPKKFSGPPCLEYVSNKKKDKKIIRKKIDLLKEEIKKKSPQISSFSRSKKREPKDFVVKFLTPKAEANFYTLLENEKLPSTRRIKELIYNIFNQPIGVKGEGRPKALKGKLKGWWERRITGKDRLIYRIKRGEITIYSYEGHL